MHVATVSHTQARTFMPLNRFASIWFLILYVTILSSTNCGLIDLIGVQEEHAWGKLKKAFQKIAIYLMWRPGYSFFR